MENNKFYHGSPIGGLTELSPYLSEHGKPYVYFATNPLIALLYAVKPVPKPFSFYPYGFDKEENLVFSEYFENAFYILYSEKKGYLYECHDVRGIEKTTQINCVYTCTEPVRVDKVTEISDLYEYYKEQEEKGLFYIKKYTEIGEGEMNLVISELKKDMEKYKLKIIPEHEMSVFIKTHFPLVWNLV